MSTTRNEREPQFSAQRAALLRYAAEVYGTQPDYPFADDDVTAVLRHAGNRRWYVLLMHLPPQRLGLAGDAPIDVATLKLDPIMVGSLQLREGFHPPYHMQKGHWLSVRLDDTVPLDEIAALTDMSYALTAPKLRKAAHCTDDEGASERKSARRAQEGQARG